MTATIRRQLDSAKDSFNANCRAFKQANNSYVKLPARNSMQPPTDRGIAGNFTELAAAEHAILSTVEIQTGVNLRMPSTCCCALQSKERSIRRVRPITVMSNGWWPAAISSTIFGDKNPS